MTKTFQQKSCNKKKKREQLVKNLEHLAIHLKGAWQTHPPWTCKAGQGMVEGELKKAD